MHSNTNEKQNGENTWEAQVLLQLNLELRLGSQMHVTGI